MVEKTVWQLFEEMDQDENISLAVSMPDVKVLRLEDGSGDGFMTVYRILDGVYLMYNDLHMMTYDTGFQQKQTVLAIDHTGEGRFEHRSPDGRFYYHERGQLMLDRRVHHAGKVTLPLCHYHGITIGFELGVAEKSIREAMPQLGLDLRSIADRFCPDDNPHLYSTDERLESIFEQLYRLPAKVEIDYLKIKVLEILVFLSTWQPEHKEIEQQYFYRDQVEKVKAIHDLITEDSAHHYTLSELSEKFSITETAMKKCFHAVYGTSIYAYTKAYRLQKAALLLKQERELSIAEIALKAGYSSHSKFSEAFRRQFSLTPQEYRIQNQ